MTYHAERKQGRGGAPLVLTFHGTGGTEQQFHGFAASLLPDAHVVSPRGDVSEHGALRFFRRAAEGVYDMEDLAARTAAMAAFIKDEIARTGAREVIGLGYSNGANILASVMLTAPALIDQAVLLHPLIPWTPAPTPALSGRRVLITAGQADPICPAPQTQAFADFLQEQSVDLTLDWHPGGHEIRETEVDAIKTFLA